MTPEETKNLIREEIINMLGDYSKIPLELVKAFTVAGFVRVAVPGTGIPKANGLEDSTIISPALGTTTVYVAAGSGGAVTHPITFTDGILTTP